MARTFKYVGGIDEVVLPATGQTVKRGHEVTIEDPEVAKGLDGQADWEHIPDKKRSAAAKKAATPEPAPAEPTEDDAS